MRDGAWLDRQSAISAGYRMLAREAVRAAIRDAMSGRDEFTRDTSRYWLMSTDGRAFCEMAGMDFLLIQRWIEAGCPTPERVPLLAGHRMHGNRKIPGQNLFYQ